MASIPSSYYCFLPSGKPDPRKPRPEGKDTRPWVVQTPQKGNTCWYYGLKLIREQYGKDPHSCFSEGRRLEKIGSERRKLQTTLERSYQQSLAIANQLATDPNYAHRKINTLAGARTFLPTIEALQSHPTEEVRTEAANLVKVIAPFCKQDKFDDLHEFLKEDNFKKRNMFNTIFLNRLGLNPKRMYAAEYSGKSWDAMTTVEKGPYLDSLAFRASYQVCYQLSESPWHPSQPISQLISSLETFGPHYVKGMYGKSFYQSEPLAMKDKIKGRTVWYWPTGADRKELGKSHSIVIVGAKEGGSSGGLVYFVDPLDGSDPSNPEQQKIYAMSYNRLRESIVNLKQQKTFLADDGSPVYFDEVNYALYKSKAEPAASSLLGASSSLV
ncbi:MAG: hypothetical protein JSR39_06150 [Verrucomicrobia bacterium]|nr:hypothetical protein [Verrucomicrobiota bacterium]